MVKIRNIPTCNFAGDKTIHRCDSSLEIVFEDLQYDIKILLNWLNINRLKPNP